MPSQPFACSNCGVIGDYRSEYAVCVKGDHVLGACCMWEYENTDHGIVDCPCCKEEENDRSDE
jgi:hypothetical protein